MILPYPWATFTLIYEVFCKSIYLNFISVLSEGRRNFVWRIPDAELAQQIAADGYNVKAVV